MEILKAMEHTPLPLDEVIYEPSIEGKRKIIRRIVLP